MSYWNIVNDAAVHQVCAGQRVDHRSVINGDGHRSTNGRCDEDARSGGGAELSTLRRLDVCGEAAEARSRGGGRQIRKRRRRGESFVAEDGGDEALQRLAAIHSKRFRKEEQDVCIRISEDCKIDLESETFNLIHRIPKRHHQREESASTDAENFLYAPQVTVSVQHFESPDVGDGANTASTESDTSWRNP